MADYYPLLSRAVASLADQPAESRAPIYARARDALERQLRSFEPPLSEDSITAELDDLSATIRRIEDELTAPPTTDADANDASGTAVDEVTVPWAALEPPAPERPAEVDFTSQPAVEPAVPPVLRPRMPEKADNAGKKKALALFSGVALVAMLTMGLIAISRRDTAPAPTTPPVVRAPDTSGADPSKTEGRLPNAPDQPARPPEPPGAPANPPATAPAEPRADTRAPASTTGRAFMVLEAAGNAPSQFEGKTAWSFAPDPALKGEKALRALISFENAGLSIDFSIARNKDASLDASHTVMVIFEPSKDFGAVREMSPVEWRERESQNGVTLAGIVVPVQDNVFMLGLDKSDAGKARNLALLQTQKWMVFEIRLANGRRGAILVEKGIAGENAMSEALNAWK